MKTSNTISYLKTLIQEEAAGLLAAERDSKLLEGAVPGEISAEDLTAAITLAIDEVFQEHRPSRESAQAAYASIAESIDVIFRESYEASARAAKMMGAEDGFEPLDEAAIKKIIEEEAAKIINERRTLLAESAARNIISIVLANDDLMGLLEPAAKDIISAVKPGRQLDLLIKLATYGLVCPDGSDAIDRHGRPQCKVAKLNPDLDKRMLLTTLEKIKNFKQDQSSADRTSQAAPKEMSIHRQAKKEKPLLPKIEIAMRKATGAVGKPGESRKSAALRWLERESAKKAGISIEDYRRNYNSKIIPHESLAYLDMFVSTLIVNKLGAQSSLRESQQGVNKLTDDVLDEAAIKKIIEEELAAALNLSESWPEEDEFEIDVKHCVENGGDGCRQDSDEFKEAVKKLMASKGLLDKTAAKVKTRFAKIDDMFKKSGGHTSQRGIKRESQQGVNKLTDALLDEQAQDAAEAPDDFKTACTGKCKTGDVVTVTATHHSGLSVKASVKIRSSNPHHAKSVARLRAQSKLNAMVAKSKTSR